MCEINPVQGENIKVYTLKAKLFFGYIDSEKITVSKTSRQGLLEDECKNFKNS